jgi:hypothetical protein
VVEWWWSGGGVVVEWWWSGVVKEGDEALLEREVERKVEVGPRVVGTGRQWRHRAGRRRAGAEQGQSRGRQWIGNGVARAAHKEKCCRDFNTQAGGHGHVSRGMQGTGGRAAVV